MGERQIKAARSRQTWTEIEIGLLDAVIERTDAIKAIITAYERADAIGVASAIDAARRIVGWSVGVSGAEQAAWVGGILRPDGTWAVGVSGAQQTQTRDPAD